ncbi:hypothetical protein IAT40_003402 [Kwoniella sp. CBS 6097]
MNFTSGPNANANANGNNPYPAITHPVHQASSVPVPTSYGQREIWVPPSTLPMSNGLSMVNPPDIAMLARQGYLQQQQQLVAMGQYGHPTMVPSRELPPSEAAQIYGITPQMQQEQLQRSIQQAQAQQRAQQQQQQVIQQQLQQQQHQQQHASQGGSGSGTGTGKKKRGPKPSAGAQLISRQTTNMQPPHSSEHYVKNALSAPSAPPTHPSHPAAAPGGGAAVLPSGEPVEPWADALDELDPRELAMGRYRRRHEVLGEVFGPESIKDIPTGKYDPWAGLGMDGETLEAKVLALEKENAELEAKVEHEVAAFKKRLAEIDAGAGVDVDYQPISTATASEGVVA